MKILKSMVVAIAAITACTIYSGRAFAQSNENCVVASEWDSYDILNEITLREAVSRLIEPVGGEDFGCNKEITFSSGLNIINMVHNLKIDRTSDAGRLIIGNGLKQITLDFKNITTDDGKKLSELPEDQKKTKCALRIIGDNITLRNIKIVNSPVMSLCIEGAYARLENVDIEDSYRSGITIAPTAIEAVIDAASSVKNIKSPDSTAVQILAEGMTANRVEGTNKVEVNPSVTDSAGFMTFDDAAFEEAKALNGDLKEENFTIAYAQNLFSSKQDSRIVVNSISPVGNGAYVIWGAVAKESKEVLNAVNNSEDACNPINYRKDVSRIQVYAYTEGTDKSVSAKFITYITDASLSMTANCSTVAGLQQKCGLVLASNNAQAGAGETIYSGEFRIRVDTANDPRFTGVGYILLIPEFTDYTLGKSTKLIPLLGTMVTSKDVAECNIVNKGQNPDPTNPSGNYGGGTWDYRYTRQECESIIKNGGGQYQQMWDSDKDGVWDMFEDTTAPFCQYNEGDASDMWSADTDLDGLSDAIEEGKKVGNRSCIIERDCDNGGVNDGKEDRNGRLAEIQAMAGKSISSGYLFSYYTHNPVYGSNGKLITCDLTGEEIGNGVGYHVFKIDGEKSIPVSNESYIYSTGDNVDIYECRHQIFFDKTNFNGIDDGDGAFETSIEDPNDDKPNSTCKWGTMVDGKCQFTCNSNSSYEVLYLVSDQNYVTGLENGGKPTGLKDIKKVTVNSDGTTALSEGSDGIPDIIQEKTCDEIRSICSDIDGDKLPDCLEMPVPNTCYTGTFSAAGGTKYLNPFVADTDGDDISDGIDSDPFGTGGEADIKLFLNAKTIAVCADRDNDGLYDIQEDVDLNGEGIGKTKTDPLKADTDSDGLNDKIEKFTSMTDPLLEDSDGDNLPDGAEIASGDPRVYNFEVQGSVIGCKPGIQLANYTQFYGDTNPQAGVGYDTDGDGLPDGVEVMLGTNPNNPDSDGDKKKDGEEKLFWDSAEIAYNESDPCSTDTDDDGIKDNVDKCPNNPDVSCDHISEWGPDDDNDGLPNSFEEMMNTDPKNDDSDNDGLVDGCDKNGDGELCWHVKHNDFKSTAINTDEGETDPRPCPNGENNSQDGFTLSSEFTEGEGVTSFCGATICVACGSDTDGDCLPDYFEKEGRFNTNGGNPDTDNDQIPDGIEAGWVVAKEVGGIGSGKFILVKGSTKTKYQDNGTQTDPANADTDGDGVLCDGNCGPRSFEDYNCNGKVDIDVSLTPKEIDPRLIDSDGDGIPDPTELCNENGCGVMNMGRAVSFDRGGCSGSIGGASGETWGMTIMFAVMLGATRVASFVMRKTRKSKARAK